MRSPRRTPVSALATAVLFDEDSMHAQLTDGRVISVPLEWFPGLRDATPSNEPSGA